MKKNLGTIMTTLLLGLTLVGCDKEYEHKTDLYVGKIGNDSVKVFELKDESAPYRIGIKDSSWITYEFTGSGQLAAKKDSEGYYADFGAPNFRDDRTYKVLSYLRYLESTGAISIPKNKR